MTTPLYDVVPGWTGVLGPFTLRLDGVPFDLTGMTVSVVMTRADGTEFTPGGTLAVLNQVSFPGQVTFAPASTDFIFQPNRYSDVQSQTIRFKVTDSLGKIVFFPNERADQIEVNRA